MTATQTLLLTRLSALGDIIHTWPLAEALAASGRFRLLWLVEAPFLPLVSNHPAVAEAIPVATRRWRKPRHWASAVAEVRALVARLRRAQPILALDPQGLCKSALWPALVGVPRRIGWAATHRRERVAGLFYTETVQLPTTLHHVVDCNLFLAKYLGAEVTFGLDPDASFLRPKLPPAPQVAEGVLLLPASGDRRKNWPPEAYARLASALAAVGYPVTVLWGPGEKSLAEAIVSRADNAQLAPPTDLLQLAGFLARGRLVVGGDTGPVHLAAALGTPTVALYLTTDPQRNGPRGQRVVVISAAEGTAKRGRARTAATRPITVKEVLGVCLRLLGDSV